MRSSSSSPPVGHTPRQLHAPVGDGSATPVHVGSARRHRGVGSLARGLIRRAGAALVLAAALGGVPFAIQRLTGAVVPQWAVLRSAWTTGRIDDTTVLHVGALVFSVLWLWFAVTALSEVVVVVRARASAIDACDPVLAPVPASPAGWVRSLVRMALISATALVGSGVAPLLLRGTELHAAASSAAGGAPRPAAVATARTIAPRIEGARAAPIGASVVVAGPRDTPYSIAVRLGDPGLRDRIVALNDGRIDPSGGVWTGGVFAPGTSVIVPVTPRSATSSDESASGGWRTHEVRPGESVHAIAADVAHDDPRSTARVAEEILDRNLGRVMVDGRTFDDASLLQPGWLLDVPVGARGAAGSLTQLSDVDTSIGHVVVPGDSYWRIAEDRLADVRGADAAAREVAIATVELRDLNAPLLGHDDPNLIIPGELVLWAHTTAAARVPTPAPSEPADPPADDSSVGTDPAAGDAAPPEELAVDPTAAAADVDADADAPSSTPVPAPPTTARSVEQPGTTPTAAGADRATPFGATTPGLAEAPAAPVPTVVDGADDSTSAPLAIAATAALATGAIGLLEARRRQQLRRATVRSRIAAPTAAQITAETALRELAAPDRALRLDVALRAAAAALVPLQRHIVVVAIDAAGGIDLVLDDVAEPVAPWGAGSGFWHWSLPPTAAISDLADAARRSGPPCPALVPLGWLADDRSSTPADVHVDLEALGLLCVDGGDDHTAAADVVTAIASTLAVSPLAESARTILVGLDPRAGLAGAGSEAVATVDEALDAAATHLGSTRSATAGRRTFALRATAADGRGETWDPAIVVACDATVSAEEASDLVALTSSSGRGLAVVVDRALHGAQWVLRPSRERDGTWVLEPLGVRIEPARLDPPAVAAVADLLDAATADLPQAPSAEPSDAPQVTGPRVRSTGGGVTSEPIAETSPFEERPWALVVRVLGGVSVDAPDGTSVEFARSKSLELVAWLATHRERPTRTAARTALWELDVRATTFANVVSDARRSMARLVAPAAGEEWIERTLTEHLPLHSLVVSDAELLADRVAAARALPSSEAIAVLEPGLERVTDLPFAGTGYVWSDAEGITSALTILVTGAATELARHHLAQGDIDGVFRATGRGLKVLPGHEELICLRMRAHATAGDLAAVRSEWEVYERALHADPWSTGEPSPKLVAVRRELLSR